MATILIADDESKMRKILSLALQEEGHEILEAKDAKQACDIIGTTSLSLVISDLRMPEGGGMAVLEAVQKINHYTPVIILTAYGTIENAVETLKNGATDYLLKPCDLDEIKMAVTKALQVQHLELENIYLRNEVQTRFGDGEMVGKSEPFIQVLEIIRRVAQGDSTVLIRGESGTGKELAARLIHQNSPRSQAAFVTVNCKATPADLLELELFGRVRSQQGSTTPAVGKVELADKGTLFLDEIGEIPPRIQSKILRSIEENVIDPVGGERSKPVDVRIIAATRMDLEEKVRQNEFRSDLYYRLNVVPILIPPLRDRKEDIPLLVQRFISRKTHGKSDLYFTGEDMEIMKRYHWPGNVRELENVVERAVVLGSTDIRVLLPALRPSLSPSAQMDYASELGDVPYKEAKRKVLDDFDREYFTHMLRKTRGNVSRAAQESDVHRKNLHVKLNELGIDPHDFHNPEDN